jgi:predicted alpha/beta superfamily hydrolase
MKREFILLFFTIQSFVLSAQDSICINQAIQHTITSTYLNEERNYWISLPLEYSDTNKYPVIYVFDAEWRFELIRNMAFDMGANQKIENAIIVGIPHIEWEYKRGQDLTFSQSRIEYDGEAVDSTWYNQTNSGSGIQFYQYLTKELIPDVNRRYATNRHETLIGHSYGGYFGGYILSLDHPFEVIHMYDPSIWYSNGEVIHRFNQKSYTKDTKIHITYQGEPAFHKRKIAAFISILEKCEHITLSKQFYSNETHNSLFLNSFYKGILQTNMKPKVP